MKALGCRKTPVKGPSQFERIAYQSKIRDTQVRVSPRDYSTGPLGAMKAQQLDGHKVHDPCAMKAHKMDGRKVHDPCATTHDPCAMKALGNAPACTTNGTRGSRTIKVPTEVPECPHAIKTWDPPVQ
jgi:hypothetical protein